MDENKKSQLIAEAENVDAIRDFLTEWWSVKDLYETSAVACSQIMYAAAQLPVFKDHVKTFQDFMEQHLMMIDLIKKFERKEGEV